MFKHSVKPCVLLRRAKCDWSQSGRDSRLDDEVSGEIMRLLRAAHTKQENQVYYYKEGAFHIVVDENYNHVVNIVYTANYASEHFVWLNHAAQTEIGDAFMVTSKPLFTSKGSGQYLLTDAEFCLVGMKCWFGD